MTLDQLRIFVAVAERQHVTRAADALHLTQSAVSGALKALETRHDIVLFSRIGRRVELTAEGGLFLEHARAVLQVADQAERSLLALRGLERGIIHVHASQTTGAYWLPARLASFHAQYPALELKLSLANTGQVAEAVRSGTAEIGLIEGVLPLSDLVTEKVDIDRLVVVGSPNHPLARSGRLSLRQVFEAQWIMREPGSGTRSVFENELVRRGLDPAGLPISMELPSNEMICSFVEAGMGLTAISEAVVRHLLQAGRLISLEFVALERSFLLLRHPERSLTRAARALATHLRTGHPVDGERPRR